MIDGFSCRIFLLTIVFLLFVENTCYFNGYLSYFSFCDEISLSPGNVSSRKNYDFWQNLNTLPKFSFSFCPWWWGYSQIKLIKKCVPQEGFNKPQNLCLRRVLINWWHFSFTPWEPVILKMRIVSSGKTQVKNTSAYEYGKCAFAEISWKNLQVFNIQEIDIIIKYVIYKFESNLFWNSVTRHDFLLCMKI